MGNINCKKCGMSIDPTLGECPHCGAVYYVISEEDRKLDWAMDPGAGLDDTRVLGRPAPKPQEPAHNPLELENADSDELFNTRVWRQSEAEQMGYGGQRPPEPQRRPAPPRPEPVRRPVPPPERPPVRRPTAGQYAQEQREKKTKQRQLVIAGVALLAVLILVLSLMSNAFNFGGGKQEEAKMPYLIGFREEMAVTILEEKGLEVRVEREEADAPVGEVIRQSIKEDKIIRKGDKITLTVSEGKPEDEYIEVPSLTGSTYDEAKQALVTLGLGIARGDDVFSDKPIGEIVSQSPMKGAKLQKGDTITVTLSKGLEPSPTPTSYNIVVTAGKGGSVNPRGTVAVEEDGDITFTFTPDPDYEIREVKVDGKDIGPVDSYTFTKVRGDHTIYVVFRQKPAESPSPSPEAPASPPAESGNPLGWVPNNPLEWWFS